MRDIYAEEDLFPRVLPARWKRLGACPFGMVYEERGGLRVIASVERHDAMCEGPRWAHVSVSRARQLPTWNDLVAVKELFLGEEREAIHFLPKRSEHVNLHEFCLHIWSCLDADAAPGVPR